MAFVRVKRHGEREYYYLVESYRENGKVKQRILSYLGIKGHTSRPHDEKVEVLQRMLLAQGFPILPTAKVSRGKLFIPDLLTRNRKLIPVDFVNARNNINYDLGGLALLVSRKVERCVAVLDNTLWDKYSKRLGKAQHNLPKTLTIIPMREAANFFYTLCTEGKRD